VTVHHADPTYRLHVGLSVFMRLCQPDAPGLLGATLSGGGVAGIAVGVTAFVALAVVGAIVLHKRLRQNSVNDRQRKGRIMPLRADSSPHPKSGTVSILLSRTALTRYVPLNVSCWLFFPDTSLHKLHRGTGYPYVLDRAGEGEGGRVGVHGHLVGLE
jgi:hypothetical protein